MSARVPVAAAVMPISGIFSPTRRVATSSSYLSGRPRNDSRRSLNSTSSVTRSFTPDARASAMTISSGISGGGFWAAAAGAFCAGDGGGSNRASTPSIATRSIYRRLLNNRFGDQSISTWLTTTSTSWLLTRMPCSASGPEQLALDGLDADAQTRRAPS